MAKKPTTAVAKKGSTDLATTGGADFFGAHAGAGFENVTADDLIVPRLTILQSLSPQLKKSESSYIEGAEVGNICEVGTGAIFPDGILFVPVYYRKDYLEWAPRNSGGGLVAVHSDPSIMEQTTRNDRNQPILPNGNLVNETAQFYGFNLSNNRQRCFIPFTSTQLKKARKWMTLATGERLKRSDGSEFTPPLFYRSYELGTAHESNNQGDWEGWIINPGPAVPDLDMGFDWQAFAQDCVEFRRSLIDGEARGDLSSEDPNDAPATDEGAM